MAEDLNVSSLEEAEVEPEFGTCVVLTLDSMISEMAGKKVMLSGEDADFRREQMKVLYDQTERRFEDVDKNPTGLIAGRVTTMKTKELISRWRPVAVRADQMAISNLIRRVQDGGSEAGKILSSAEIRYEKGGIEEARQFIEDGWEVGMMTMIPTGMGEGTHVFHLGMDLNGNLRDKSDDFGVRYTQETIMRMLNKGLLDIATRKLQKETGGWNLILMRKKD